MDRAVGCDGEGGDRVGQWLGGNNPCAGCDIPVTYIAIHVARAALHVRKRGKALAPGRASRTGSACRAQRTSGDEGSEVGSGPIGSFWGELSGSGLRRSQRLAGRGVGVQDWAPRRCLPRGLLTTGIAGRQCGPHPKGVRGSNPSYFTGTTGIRLRGNDTTAPGLSGRGLIRGVVGQTECDADWIRPAGNYCWIATTLILIVTSSPTIIPPSITRFQTIP